MKPESVFSAGSLFGSGPSPLSGEMCLRAPNPPVAFSPPNLQPILKSTPPTPPTPLQSFLRPEFISTVTNLSWQMMSHKRQEWQPDVCVGNINLATAALLPRWVITLRSGAVCGCQPESKQTRSLLLKINKPIRGKACYSSAGGIFARWKIINAFLFPQREAEKSWAE